MNFKIYFELLLNTCITFKINFYEIRHLKRYSKHALYTKFRFYFIDIAWLNLQEEIDCRQGIEFLEVELTINYVIVLSCLALNAL